MQLSNLFQKSASNLPILQGNFGVERESLRISKNIKLSSNSHPSLLGNRSFHPYIQTDYSEAQLELITPVATSTKEVLRQLGAITDVVSRTLEGDDYLWPLSMPPRIIEDEIKVAALENDFEYKYRVRLGEKYGKLLQSMSGIHYNFELGKELTQELFKLSDYDDLVAFKNDLYLKLAQNFLHYRWLLTYLYGASPIAEAGFLKTNPSYPVRSIRNSSYGYVNFDEVKVSFKNLERYVRDIESCVATGKLSAEKEFYSAVRLRGSKYNRDYLSKGIKYLEFRCFDLDPFEHLAISQETMDFVHLFILTLLWMDSLENVDDALLSANKLNDNIALSHPLTPLPKEADATAILEAMTEMVEHFALGNTYKKVIEQTREMVANPSLTLSGRLLNYISDNSLEEFGQKQGHAHLEYAWQASYALKGYENMELSTQMILFDAIQMGIHVEILDENDQFLKLWHGNHVEYIKNGNMTSKDNYVIPLAMENKTVTKKILAAAGFPVPAGDEFSNKNDALAYYSQIADKAIVIKPKSTNFGLGISIFQEAASFEDYEKALDIAFSEDKDILVEEFISGTEYRFFVLDGKCEAVLLRVAANVVGDGHKTVRELVAKKNKNPLRGRDHRSPLEIINLGNIECLMLEQQGYEPDSVLPEGLTVYLRGNSNISTGGDSIDVTDNMDSSYKQLAADMATTLGAWACGVDLIIPDHKKVWTSGNQAATCIELNFNPSMYMHTYCHAGPGQVITKKILQKLFPELEK